MHSKEVIQTNPRTKEAVIVGAVVGMLAGLTVAVARSEGVQNSIQKLKETLPSIPQPVQFIELPLGKEVDIKTT